MTVQVAPLLRTLFVLFTAVLIMGILVAVIRGIRQGRGLLVCGTFCVGLLVVGALFTLTAIIAQYLVAPATYTPQGRYFFPFLPAMAVLGTWGWLALWPNRLHPAALTFAWFALAAYDLYAWAYVLLPTWYS